MIAYNRSTQKSFEPDSNPKKVPRKAQKRAKKVPNEADLKIIDGAVLPKLKLVVYISRSQKSF